MKKVLYCLSVLLLMSPCLAIIWSEPVLLPELNDPAGYNAVRPCLSSDGLTMYFTRKKADGISRMWEAYRDTPTGAFTTEREISELYDGRALYTGWVSEDNLRMYYTKSESYHDRTILRMAQRSSTSDPWQEVMTFWDIHTYHIYDSYCSLSPDELTLYYTRGDTPNYYEIYKAARTSITEQFSNPVPVTELNGLVYTHSPFIMPDGQSIFYTAGANNTIADLYMATRSSMSDPFGDIEFLNINTSGVEAAPYVTPDGMTLYFHTSEGICMSEQIPEPATCLLVLAGGMLLKKRTR